MGRHQSKEGNELGSQNEKKEQECSHRASNNRGKGEKEIRHLREVIEKQEHRQMDEWINRGGWKEMKERMEGEDKNEKQSGRNQMKGGEAGLKNERRKYQHTNTPLNRRDERTEAKKGGIDEKREKIMD